MPMSRDMYTMAFRLLQQPEEAEDIVQDILLELYERPLSPDPSPPKGKGEDNELKDKKYVMAMVRNRCIDRMRTSLPLPLSPEGERGEEEPIGPSPEAQIEARDYLEQILQSLPEQVRTIVRLRIIDDLSFDEIAERTGLTAGNARVIVSRCLNQLKNKNKTP